MLVANIYNNITQYIIFDESFIEDTAKSDSGGEKKEIYRTRT